MFLWRSKCHTLDKKSIEVSTPEEFGDYLQRDLSSSETNISPNDKNISKQIDNAKKKLISRRKYLDSAERSWASRFIR